MAKSIEELFVEAAHGECPSCGAPAEEPCSPDCESTYPPQEPDPDRAYDMRNEAAGDFDKFMDRILSEGKSRVATVDGDNPLRRRAAQYQERPLGRIRMGGRK